MASKDVHFITPRIIGECKTSHGRRDFADVIKFRILRWEDYPGLSGERVREGETEGEKYQCVLASRTPPAGDLACNPGVCPDWELNTDALLHGLALNQLSHISQGDHSILFIMLALTYSSQLIFRWKHFLKFPII
ncbi:hypothetical protein HJG60_010847 [Phyllostomus discolor]|uniref:Uncharacterized protein n=1 Tax=Phyllostomus discolor TaxID=89673 RepID=A0A834A6T9_9CHIR|nr:hypothetical protein HJG60_010847 [Phyllostomus discolor]